MCPILACIWPTLFWAEALRTLKVGAEDRWSMVVPSVLRLVEDASQVLA